MKSYEQMTKDVLKRRDEELRPSNKFTKAARVIVPCASVAAGVAVIFGGVSVLVPRGKYVQNCLDSPEAESSANSAEITWQSSVPSTVEIVPDPGNIDIATDDRLVQPNFTNPNAGQNDIHVLEVGMFNSDDGVKTDPIDLSPYSMESLCSFYGLEFDRLTKLHSSWGLQHEPLGIYKKQSSDGFSFSMSMYCTRNTLNYTTDKGANISVSAQLGKFEPLWTEMFAIDKPFEPTVPDLINEYDDNGNLIGQIAPGYNPDNDPAPRPVNDEGVSLLNGYDAYIYRDHNGSFAADINMGTRVRITAVGLSEAEFLEILDEYTK